MSAVFLETSALGRALFGEDGGPQISERLEQADSIVASRLLKVEAERAVLRHALDDPGFDSQVSEVDHELRDLWVRVNFIEITREVCAEAGRIAPSVRLRALDAIHLATFRLVQRIDPTIEMLTFDERLLEATSP